MGNKRKRRSRRVESQSSDRDEITSETSFTHGNATLVDVSEKVNYIFDRDLVSELAEPSQTRNEMEGFSQRLAERKSTEMSQIEEQLNSKFGEKPKEITANKFCDVTNREKDDGNRSPGPSSSGIKYLNKTHQILKDRTQDNCFSSSDMDELRQPSYPLGVVN